MEGEKKMKGQYSYLGKYFGSKKVNNLQGNNSNEWQDKAMKRVKGGSSRSKNFDKKNIVLSMVNDRWEGRLRKEK